MRSRRAAIAASLAFALAGAACSPPEGAPELAHAPLEPPPLPSHALEAAAVGDDAQANQGPTTPLRPANAWIDPGLPARAPIQGAEGELAGFEWRSRVVYASAPDRPHELFATYVFPDRARWRLFPIGDSDGDRILVYQHGKRAFLVPAKSSASVELEDAERENILRTIGLRLATTTWPDGQAWTGDSTEQTAPLLVAGEPIGELRASLGDDGLPAFVSVHTLDGVEQDRFVIRAWRELHGREWPVEMTLRHAGNPVFEERLEEVTTRAGSFDSFFLPSDRRNPGDGTATTGSVLITALPQSLQTIIPLPASCTWEEAEQAWRAARDAAALEVEDVTSFAIGDDGLPVGCILRASSPDATDASPPEGWEQVPAREGLTVLTDGTKGIAKAIVSLEAASGGAQRSGEAYARRFSDGRWQVVLPLATTSQE